MVIGIPREIMNGEGRVSAIPQIVQKLIGLGYQVLVERSAGEGAHFPDEAYAQAGAKLIDSARDVYAAADIILKVKEPQYNQALGCHEVDMMHAGQVLITFIHPAAPSNHEMVRNMAKKGVTSLTLDGVPRISRAQKMDALTSMSTCAGYKGMLIASNSLAKFVPMIFCAAGQIKPSNVLVVGVGVAGLQALATAKRLGAMTYAADIRPDAIEQAKSLGAKIVDLGVPPEVATGPGGYAMALSDEWIQKEREALSAAVKQMDVVFLSALVPSKLAPILITEDMVKSMQPGSVIVDVSIDQGGNCDITDPGSSCVKHGVTIDGIKNIPGMLPTSSTWMFANNVYNLVEYLTKDGRIEIDRGDEIVSGILTTIDGQLVHRGAIEAMGVEA